MSRLRATFEVTVTGPDTMSEVPESELMAEFRKWGLAKQMAADLQDNFDRAHLNQAVLKNRGYDTDVRYKAQLTGVERIEK